MDERDRKALLRRTFNAVSEGYDNDALRFFRISAGHMADYLNPRAGERVLDVATGTGHVAMALAGRLPGGGVVGIDFSEGMLDRARAKCGERGISNVEFRAMDMQALDFPDGHFDAAVSAFGLFFVNDMCGQLKHMAGKVRPGGRVLITSFLDRPFIPLGTLFFEHVQQYGVAVDPESLKRLSTMEECAALFENAGLSDIRVEERSVGYHLVSADQWWDVIWNAGFRRFVGMIAPGDAERFRAEHLGRIEELKTDKGIWLDVNVLHTSGMVRP